jgi:CRISPR/Cas system-associated exonuclease Cas4 (RecB family)
MEKFAVGEIPSDFREWFDSAWEETLKRNYKSFAQKWSPNVVNSPATWKMYFNTKNICRQMASQVYARRTRAIENEVLPPDDAPKFKRFSEHRFKVDHLGLVGMPDLVFVNGDTATIVDFKFGQKNEDNVRYAFQLHFYLILVEHELSVRVTKLVIRFGIDDERIIEINRELVEEIRNQISSAHKSIESMELHAEPSLDNCRYCSVKRDCKEFLSSDIRMTGNYPLSVQGTIEKVSQTGDSYQTIELKPRNVPEVQRVTISRVPIGYILEAGQLIILTDNLDFHSYERIDFQWNSSIYSLD